VVARSREERQKQRALPLGTYGDDVDDEGVDSVGSICVDSVGSRGVESGVDSTGVLSSESSKDKVNSF